MVHGCVRARLSDSSFSEIHTTRTHQQTYQAMSLAVSALARFYNVAAPEGDARAAAAALLERDAPGPIAATVGAPPPAAAPEEERDDEDLASPPAANGAAPMALDWPAGGSAPPLRRQRYVRRELLARVRSLLRRDSRAVSAVTVVGELEPDDARHEAKRGMRRLDLTAKEFALLRYFMLHAGEVLSQEELLEHVWDEHADPFTNTVRVTVGTLRRKVSLDGETPLIETLIGSGYRLLDP
jgi:DNA-binding winged helix-turn-helix (wHTH) protein